MAVNASEVNGVFSNDPCRLNSTYNASLLIVNDSTSHDASPTQAICIEFHFVIIFLGGSVCLVLGVIGNGLTVFTLWPDRNRNTTTLLLITLAVFNSLELVVRYAILSVPQFCRYLQTFQNFLCEYYFNWGKPYLVAYGHPVAYIFYLAGIWNVVLVTICRYVAVCYPTKAKQWCSMGKIYIAIACILVGSVIFNIPAFLANYVDYTGDKLAYRVHYREFTSISAYKYGYQNTLYFAVIYVVPFISLTFMTAKLVWRLKMNEKRRTEMTLQMKREDGITWILVTIVITFMLCQLIEPFVRIMHTVLPLAMQYHCSSSFSYWRAISALGLMVNASTNFIIYCNLGQFGRHFRKQLRQRLGLPVAIASSTSGSSTQTQRTGIAVTGESSTSGSSTRRQHLGLPVAEKLSTIGSSTRRQQLGLPVAEEPSTTGSSTRRQELGLPVAENPSTTGSCTSGSSTRREKTLSTNHGQMSFACKEVSNV